MSYFNTLLEFVAKADFEDKDTIAKIKTELHQLKELLHGHAHHEELKIHDLLKRKGSSLYQQVESEHREHAKFYINMESKIEALELLNDPIGIHYAGNEIYLDIRKFYADNLNHLDYEERVLLPELQKHCTDLELREIFFETYHIMTSDQMKDMLIRLFPHMNKDDKVTFLKDIQDSEPAKFESAWLSVAQSLDEQEENQLMHALGMTSG